LERPIRLFTAFNRSIEIEIVSSTVVSSFCPSAQIYRRYWAMRVMRAKRGVRTNGDAARLAMRAMRAKRAMRVMRVMRLMRMQLVLQANLG
jgi:hypothetical protein